MGHLGPQDIERGIQGTPSKEVEGLLCALLGLVLNRKKPVEYVCTTGEGTGNARERALMPWSGQMLMLV